jgi:glycosyltransferase involved in cell wall biosynthesis
VKLAGRGSYVLTQHFLIPTRATRRGWKGALSNALHRWISRGAGWIIAISEASRRGIEARGESCGNVTTAPNGIPEPEGIEPRDKVRAGLGIAEGTPLIVCAARLEAEKDVATLVDAMAEVGKTAPDAVCVVAGEGSQRAMLEEKIAALNLGETMRLLGFRKDAQSIIAAGDLFILPSLAEPFGLVLVEAMALGKAVIGTDAGGPREIVEQEVTGLLVKPGDAVEMGAAIARLASDSSMRAAMGVRGRERYERLFTLQRMTRDILAIYRRALGEEDPKRKLRVLLISHTCQTRNEGQPKADELGRLGDINLMVLTPERFNHYGIWKNAEIPDSRGYGYAVRKVMWPWLGPFQNYLHWYPSLGGILRRFKPDIIDLWEEPWGLVSAHACWLRNRILPDATVLMESEQNIDKSWPPPFRWLEKYTLRNANFAVGRSSGVIDVLRKKGYTGPARVVGNAANTDLFKPMDREACKRELGLKGFVAGYAGRLVERKGLTDLIDALKFCPSDVTVLFVGGGEQQPVLEERARAAGVADRVRFLPTRKLEELPPIMNAMDVFVLPSWTVPSWKEQFGRVIIEAHACQTPVIGSDSGAIPDVVGEGGLIFPERDAQKLAEAIMELHRSPDRARRMGAAGRAQVEARYTWHRVAEQMRDIYIECAPSKPNHSKSPEPELMECR